MVGHLVKKDLNILLVDLHLVLAKKKVKVNHGVKKLLRVKRTNQVNTRTNKRMIDEEIATLDERKEALQESKG